MAKLQYTGGTTGASKGVMLTYKNLLSNVIQVCDFTYRTCENRPDDFKIMSVLPMFHVYGLSCNALSGIREGANQLVLPRFDVKEMMDIVKREKPFQMSAVPTMYFALNSQEGLGECGFEDIYYLSSGGAPLPIELARVFEEKTGCKLYDGYGLSEMLPSAIFTPPFLPPKEGSIGIPVPGTEARIVKVTGDHVEDVPVGEEGELIVILVNKNLKGY
ncbi:AMP-binding protein [Bacillus sp. V5-8f]|uniref:AMP-binding protein n=1 Tax=Bacillus sp. V5-8f TaxID=2053044 RepID=UPI002155AD17|nr:AMP-binding protein [Bacillus sp. V5-8f]